MNTRTPSIVVAVLLQQPTNSRQTVKPLSWVSRGPHDQSVVMMDAKQIMAQKNPKTTP